MQAASYGSSHGSVQYGKQNVVSNAVLHYVGVSDMETELIGVIVLSVM